MKIVRMLKQPMPSVQDLRVTILVEDSVSMKRPEVMAKHGLSLLVISEGGGVPQFKETYKQYVIRPTRIDATNIIDA